jgi:hypothetical protein
MLNEAASQNGYLNLQSPISTGRESKRTPIVAGGRARDGNAARQLAFRPIRV